MWILLYIWLEFVDVLSNSYCIYQSQGYGSTKLRLVSLGSKTEKNNNYIPDNKE